MPRALITGAAGSIGYYLARRLLSAGYRLDLVDNLQRGRADAAFSALCQKPHVTFKTLDLTDPAAYEELGNEYDQVYHLAAVNGTKSFYEMPHAVLRTNTLSLVFMLDWFQKYNRGGKFLFTSSNEAYAGALQAFGQLPIPTPEEVPLIISDPYNPRWSYASTKLLGELFVIHYAQQYDFRAVIVRPHNFYGPRSGYDHVIPELCMRIRNRFDPFPVYGGLQTRTFCYLEDAVEAMQLLLESSVTDSQPIETVHIGGSEEITMDDLARRLFVVSGWSPSALEKYPAPIGSVDRRVPELSKIRNLVGWEPKTQLNDGLVQTYRWYSEQVPPPASPAV